MPVCSSTFWYFSLAPSITAMMFSTICSLQRTSVLNECQEQSQSLHTYTLRHAHVQFLFSEYWPLNARDRFLLEKFFAQSFCHHWQYSGITKEQVVRTAEFSLCFKLLVVRPQFCKPITWVRPVTGVASSASSTWMRPYPLQTGTFDSHPF